MKVARRIPKRGFNNRWAKSLAVVNVRDLNQAFDDGAVVDLAGLRQVGLVSGVWDGVKILGDGEITKKLTVSAHKFSKSAEAKITGAGGRIQVL
jgi:large subunit ribosomal protein L15